MPLDIDTGQTIDTKFGWVFFYNTEKYLCGGDPLESLAGNAPLLVDEDGKLHEMGTDRSIEHYIAEYERIRSANRVAT